MKYEKGNFIVVPNQELMKGLHPSAQCLYVWLCFHANQEGTCFPSRMLLAQETGMSMKMVDKMLKVLIERELVLKNNRFENNEKKTNLYYLPIRRQKKVGVGVAHSVGEGREYSGVGREQGALGVGNTVPEGREQGAHRTQSIELNPIELNPDNSIAAQTPRDISELIDLFKSINPAYKKFYANKTQQKSAGNLLEQHGKERVFRVIAFLSKSNKLPYFPTIISPSQLEDKWASLESAVNKKRVESKIDQEKYKVAFTG